VRLRGIGLLVLVVGELLVGNELALAGSPYPIGYLAAHIVLAILLVGLSAHATLLAFRRSGSVAKAAGLLALLGTAGAGVAGVDFLYGGQGNPALDAMEALGGLALLAAILLIAFGSVRPTAAAST
jgi:hypothetical protein